MQIKLKLISLSCMVAIATFSCKKTKETPISTPVTTQSLNELFAGLRSSPQIINVNAGRDTVVFGESGTMLHFHPGCFKDAAGTIITSGNIEVKLVEMYKPGDMIRNRATTMAGAQLLTSRGQAAVTASMGGQKITAGNYGIGFYKNNPANEPMGFFNGGVKNADSVVSWDAKDTLEEWDMVWPVDGARRAQLEIVYGRPWMGYVFDASSTLEYTNADAFYLSDSPKVSVSIVLPDASFSPTNTQLYLVLPDINCAMSTVQTTAGGGTFGTARYDAATKTMKLISETQTNIVPAGMKYILIVIANKNGQYYYSKQSGAAIPHLGLNAAVTMTADSKENVLSMLSAL